MQRTRTWSRPYHSRPAPPRGRAASRGAELVPVRGPLRGRSLAISVATTVALGALAATLAAACGGDAGGPALSDLGDSGADSAAPLDGGNRDGDDVHADDLGGTSPTGDGATGSQDPLDASPSDSVGADAGPIDAGLIDAGPIDAGLIDAGPIDAAAPDTVTPGTGTADTGTTVTGPWDADSDAAAPATALAAPLTLETKDGKQLAATEHRLSTTGDGAPGVLLIHQFNSDQSQWAPYLPALLERGLIVLTLDLRGHGASDPADGALQVILNDPAQAPLDVAAGLARLTGASGADPSRIAVIGTSIGANLACVASANGYGVKVPVAVSARDSAVANLAGKAIADLSFSGLFILATEDDSAGVQAATAVAFQAASAPPSDTLILAGADHGKDLLANHPDAVEAVLSWLDAHL